MPSSGQLLERAGKALIEAIDAYGDTLGQTVGEELGQGLITCHEAGNRLKAVFTTNLRRFDKSGEYAAEGAVDLVAWLRSRCHLSGSSAAEHVIVGRQLEHLPRTQQAFVSGELGYEHAAVVAKSAHHVGTDAVRKEEAMLLRAAESMDATQFVGVAKDFEHKVDAEAVLAEANRAHQRRYLRISDARDGIVRLDGLLDAEAGAIVRNAVNAGALPAKDDERTPEQRRADRLVELCGRRVAGSSDGAGPRPQLIVRSTVETLAGVGNAPAGELEGGGSIPSETVRRMACDAAVIRIANRGELEGETSHATRVIHPMTRRALAERDRGCVIRTCRRPPQWTDAHHIKHWAHGGPTTMSNLVLLCRTHHRMVHEEGWHLKRLPTGQWDLVPPVPNSRSA